VKLQAVYSTATFADLVKELTLDGKFVVMAASMVPYTTILPLSEKM